MTVRLISYFWVLFASLSLLSVNSSLAADTGRVSRDLRVLYTFDTGSGDIVHDRSGVGQPLNLKIQKPSAVQWKEGALVVTSSTKISSPRPAKKILAAVKRFGAISIEAWIRPRNNRQSGPARIVSISSGSTQRNITLGQDGGKYDVRLRTSSTSTNGIPSTSSPKNSLRPVLTHVVYTRDGAGNARIYTSGKEQVSKKVVGSLTNWDDQFPLLLANEINGSRPWLGTYQLVAVYSRALSAKEVAQNFRAGAEAGSSSTPELAVNKQEHFFETEIAPLLARNCVECHNSAAKKGGLDLSHKLPALAGGENGKAIVPGKSAESMLLDLVDSDDMPPEGDPLSTRNKKLLRQWIENGAVWSEDFIDTAIYANDDQTGDIWLQRLTVLEYIETVRSTLGVDIAKEAGEILPPDLRADGFSNTAYNLNVDLKQVEAYSQLAEIIVDRMDVLEFAKRFSKSESLSTDNTMRKFVASMGKWILRGPLEDREITSYSGIATTVASAGGSYQEAVTYIIEAMLQSPRFIYRIEYQRGDGTSWPVTDYELASRMSYILWGGPPDEELMEAADKGELQNAENIKSHIHRMLEDPRAIGRSSQFVVEWLDLDRLRNMQPDLKRFPQWDASLATDMRKETLEFFKEVVWKQNRPLGDLLNAQFTYLTPRLAKHYGLEPQESGLSRYNLSNVSARGGLLTQGSSLTIGGDDASMVTRGLFVLRDILRGTMKEPPPGLDTTPVPSRPGLSQRTIAEQRIANVSCGGCHSNFEPLAFGLEGFNGIGEFSKIDEHGNELREDGSILFPGAAKPVKYSTSKQLMDLLAKSDRVRETITWKVTQFALGRPLVAADARTIKKIHLEAQKNGGTYSSLITALVLSDLVRKTRTESTLSETN